MKGKELLPHYREINRLLHDKDYAGINKIFNAINLDEADAVLLIGVLRLTSIHRDNLSAWAPLRDKVDKELEHRGLNSTKILRGLLVE